MIHLFFNALAASAGAGLTYVRNVVPEISARGDARATIALTSALRREFQDLRPADLDHRIFNRRWGEVADAGRVDQLAAAR